MHVRSLIFQGQLIEKKIRSITFIVWALGRVEKMPKQGQKKFSLLSKCDTFSTFSFKFLFIKSQNISL